jgi:GDPmannose 4,6-dehydratase
LLIGDASKARKLLSWKPKYDVQMLCAEMVAADLDLFKRAQLLKDAGYDIKNEFE